MVKDVANQKHYTAFKIQPIKYIQENNLDWCQGNIVKYVTRASYKNGVEDYYKALTYLACKIKELETGKFLAPDKIDVKIRVKRNFRRP
jgi:hypothetical protein